MHSQQETMDLSNDPEADPQTEHMTVYRIHCKLGTEIP